MNKRFTSILRRQKIPLFHCGLFVSLFLCIFVLPAPSLAHAATLLKPANILGLVGYWALDDGNGTIATDHSGNSNTGSLRNGAVWASGKRGKSIDFDGLNDYVEIASTASLKFTGGNMTMSAWIYPDQTETSGSQVISKPWNGGGQYNYRLSVDSGGTISLCLFGSGGSCITTPTAVSRGAWSHISATITATQATIYVNGESAVSSPHGISGWSPSSGDGNLPLAIGTLYPYGEGWGGNTGFSFDGKIDDVRIYARTFTQAEMMSLYRSGETARKVADNLGLVGYWPLDEGIGTQAGDFSGNGNNGTLTNSPTWANGKRGKSLLFNGTNYVNMGVGSAPLESLGNTFTISAWVKTPTPNNRMTIYSSGYVCCTPMFGTSANTPGGLEIYYPGVYVAFTSGGLLAADTWYHVAYTRSGTGSGTHAFYVNGVIQTLASDGPQDFSGSGGTKYIGYRDGVIWNGNIDDVRVYNRTLSAAEINTIYDSNQTKINAPQDTKLTSGLVGFWTFNGKDLTTTTATDVSGRGNNGTLTSSPLPTIGKVGQALLFNGSNTVVDVAYNSSLAPTAAVSFGAWIKPTTTSGSQKVISKTESGGYQLGINEGGCPSAFCALVFVGGTYHRASYAISNLVANEWSHVFATYDGETLRLYLNGTEVASNTTPSGAIQYAASNSLCVGGEPGGATCVGGEHFSGSIDEPRVYNRGLSATEVRQLYLMGK